MWLPFSNSKHHKDQKGQIETTDMLHYKESIIKKKDFITCLEMVWNFQHCSSINPLQLHGEISISIFAYAIICIKPFELFVFLHL